MTRRIKLNGEFDGTCDCSFLDGTKCVLMNRETARSVLKFIRRDKLTEEDKMHVAAFMLRLEGITHGGEG